VVLLIQRCPSLCAKIRCHKWDRKWDRQDAETDQQAECPPSRYRKEAWSLQRRWRAVSGH
jgi:hypothetical protein